MKKSFYLGIALFAICLLISFYPAMLPPNLPPTAVRTLGVTLLIAVFWLAETIPLPASAIIPLGLFPFLGILPADRVASAYGSDVILLFMSGFFIATAIERWQLHRRLALHIIKLVGTQPRRLVLGFMLATAMLSMWISNAATTLMMLPIALATITNLTRNNADSEKSLGTMLMLSIAYSANIGGIGTPIGTPPNLIFLAEMQEMFPDLPQVTFWQWMLVGVPLVFIFIFLTWLYLTRVQMSPDLSISTAADIIEKDLLLLGPMSRAEKYVALLFALTALLWIFRADISIGAFTLTGWANYLGVGEFVKDSSVAASIALIMFCLPVQANNGENTYLLDWTTAVKIPWGILLLLGGGIAISQGFAASGLSAFIVDNFTRFLPQLPLMAIVLCICLFMTFLTEFMSNTAITTLMMPILAATAVIVNINPALIMWPAALSASFAFMLPAATAPNAIVYSQEYFPTATMAKTGFVLNIIGVILVSFMMYFVAIPLLS